MTDQMEAKEMEMESSSNPEMEVFDILKEAITIPYKNINFIFFTILNSFPLLCFMAYFEIVLQSTMVETLEVLSQYQPIQQEVTDSVIKDFSYKLIYLGLLYLVPLNLLELFAMLVTVDLASKLYTEGRPMNLKEMVRKPINKARLKGSFITSVYVLFLSTCSLLGFTWLVTVYVVVLRDYVVFFSVAFVAAFVILLRKYLEWTAAWNVSMVISILEDKFGVEALSLSNYISRGNERHGGRLMLFFFVLGFGLRLFCFYLRCYETGIGVVLQVCLLFVGNLVKWVASMLYFYDCKKVLQKKVDGGFKELWI